MTVLCYTVPMEYLTYEQFQQAVKVITEHVPFELILRTEPDGSTSGYVPYIMNDAMECYMVLEHCRVVGNIVENYAGQTAVEFADHTMGISVRQGDNVYTAWFSGIRQHLQLYRYHEIGHFWKQGQEQWRRLVYMVGTVYDKMKFAPKPSCNPTELRLAKLIEFAPFRVYSPVSESILSLYPETSEGAKVFAQLAEEAGDKSLARQVRFYDRHPNALMAIHIANRLAKAKSIPVYQHIFSLLSEASAQYPPRDYGAERNAAMQAERDKLTGVLHDLGFQGEYPCFRKPGREFLAAEEHPFTVLETDDYHFAIRFMVSQYPEQEVPMGICTGFFNGRKHKSCIYDQNELGE